MSSALNRGRSFRVAQYPTSSKPRETEQVVVTDEVDAKLRESLRGLRFGSVNVIVQDGVVVQIDKIEKTRLREDRNAK
jgi:hypothetical protein